MIAEFVGKASVLRDEYGKPYELDPGSKCSIEVSYFERSRWISLSILTPDGHMLTCPYDSLGAIYSNWRRADA